MRIALDQCYPVQGGGAEALARLDAVARRAAEAGADLLITPEMALTGYNIGAEAVRAAADPDDGPMSAALTKIARNHCISLVAGLPTADAAGRVHNTARLIDAEGRVVATYHKTHLYGSVDRAQFSAGPALSPVVEIAGWKVGLAICYDVEFPELVRALVLAGAEVLLVPTANMRPYDSVATRLVPARAEENEVFVAYANYCGSEGEFDYCGLSCICGPDGADLARAGRDEELIFADISKEWLAATRRHSTHRQDRRPELYTGIATRGFPNERD